jgi:hypothetical protein
MLLAQGQVGLLRSFLYSEVQAEILDYMSQPSPANRLVVISRGALVEEKILRFSLIQPAIKQLPRNAMPALTKE